MSSSHSWRLASSGSADAGRTPVSVPRAGDLMIPLESYSSTVIPILRAVPATIRIAESTS